MPYGTLSIADLQAVANNTTVVEFGLDRTFEAIQNTLDAHNRIMNELFTDLAESTTDRMRRYGGTDTMTMEDGDEFSTPHPQKIGAGANVGFPLRLPQIAFQWTRKWFQNHSPAEMAAQVDGAMTADVRRVTRELKRAIFGAINYTFNDFLVDRVDLPVKRLVNGDGDPIPVGPNGETFNASTHTHYLPRAGGSFASTDLDALITTVREHFTEGNIVVDINAAEEAAVRAFTNFLPYLDARVTPALTTASAQGKSLDVVNLYNRAIGIYNGAEIWVKSWVPAGYLFCWNTTAPKPVVYRTRPGAGNFELIFDEEVHPLRARGFEREFGFGIWNRINGAVLYANSITWTDPVITG